MAGLERYPDIKNHSEICEQQKKVIVNSVVYYVWIGNWYLAWYWFLSTQCVVIYNCGCIFSQGFSAAWYMLCLSLSIMISKMPAESWDESAAKYCIKKLLSHNESTGFEVIKSFIV